jgi:hypothetical protein
MFSRLCFDVDRRISRQSRQGLPGEEKKARSLPVYLEVTNYFFQGLKNDSWQKI